MTSAVPRFGVSPAFVVSRHGSRFTPSDYATAAAAARELGFAAMQAEIYSHSGTDEWNRGGARRVAAQFAGLGLACSQFVAHFLLDHFTTAEQLASRGELDAVARAVDAAKAFRDCRVFTVPIGAFPFDPVHAGDAGWFRDQFQRLVEKLDAYLRIVRDAGLQLALEILPFSLIGNTDGFLRVTAALNAPDLGLNLDTGHAWATRETLPLLPAKLSGRILGVHLKDGDGRLNQALAPGRGTIPWAAFLGALIASGYAGSLDLEIGCPATAAAAEYAFGLQHLRAHFA